MIVRSCCRRTGMTAVEVLTATMLSSLLMVALLGVMRGLADQSRAVDLRMPAESWRRALDAVLRADLVGARTFQASGKRLVLQAYGSGNNPTDGGGWLPTTIVYEVTRVKDRSWLTRREYPFRGGGEQSPAANLVLADVSAIRVNGSSAVSLSGPEPIPQVLSIELLTQDNNGPLYAYHHTTD